MWTAIPVIFALVGGQVKPFVGVEMPYGQCMAGSQAMMADFKRQYGYEVKGISCVEPRRLNALLGRREA